MPTRRRRTRVSREMHDLARSLLCDGRLSHADRVSTFTRRVEMAAMAPQFLLDAWETYRDEWQPAYVQACPGTRPFGWWLTEAVEPRKQLGRAKTTPMHPEQWRLYHGTGGPAAGWTIDDELDDAPDSPQYETEIEYLRRTGQLVEGEAQAAEAAGQVAVLEVLIGDLDWATGLGAEVPDDAEDPQPRRRQDELARRDALRKRASLAAELVTARAEAAALATKAGEAMAMMIEATPWQPPALVPTEDETESIDPAMCGAEDAQALAEKE